MITDDGRIKLIDFGIAKKLNDLNAEDEVKCNGAFVGKVEYASPELIDGSIYDQDFTTDIYAIGVLFYKLLTGRLPFDGNRFEIMNSHLKKKVNTRVITNKKFADIIDRAMKKKREQRFQTSSEMRVAIDQQFPPDPKWTKIMLASAIILIASIVSIASWNIIKRYSEENNNNNKDIVDPIPPKPVEDTIDFTQLSKDELWQELKKSPTNPELLFEIAKKYKNLKVREDSDALQFWNEYLVGEGYVERNLKVSTKRTISEKRFVFLTLTKAMDHATDSKLKEEIRASLTESINEFPHYYQYIPIVNQ